MSDWINYLSSQGATIRDGDVTGFTTDRKQETLLIPLLNQGVLAVEGDKAKAFLQGQVTCDVEQLRPELSLPGAQCNPKGRMLCSFQLAEKQADKLILLMAADLVTSTAESLQKYAVFFQTTLTDSTVEYAIIGVVGPEAEQVVATAFSIEPQNLQQEINAVQQAAEGMAIKLADQCFLLLIDIEQAKNLWSTLSEQARPAAIADWQKQQIKLGLGQVRLATREMFIPQMLNLQVIGAISFRKGCYTGQEVVARMKYLGKLKRRMYRLELATDALPADGCECKLSTDGQSIGNIVNAVQTEAEKVEALAVLTAEAAASEHLIIDSQQIQCRLLPLPYAITED